MGNSVGAELRPPSLDELLGETDEPERSPSARGSISAEPTFQSVLRGWKFSTSPNGLLGSTSPVHWLEFDGFSEDSCYLVVHAFVRHHDKSSKRKKSGGQGAGESEEETTERSDSESKHTRKASNSSASSGGEITGPSGSRRSSGSNSDRSKEQREAAAERLTKVLQSAETLTPRGQQNVFGGYHAPGYNRKKMTAITYDIYVLRGQNANAISKSTATAKAVEVERLLSDSSAQQAVRRLCFVSDDALVAPLVAFSNLYCMENMGMELWSQCVARNHLFATITRYSSTQRATVVRKSARSGSLPAKGQTMTVRASAKTQPEAEAEPPEPVDAGADERESKSSPPSSPPSRSRRKSRSRKKSKDIKKRKGPSTSASGKTMLDHHFRSVSLPASEMKKLKSNALGSRNVPIIQIPLGMTSLEQPVQEEDDGDDDKPMGGASMAKKFDHICSQITESLFLGSDTVARDSRELRRNKITHVLNCAGGYCGNYFPQQFQYMTLHLLDGKSENIACLFYEVLEYVDGAISNGGRVFVHCQQGVSRSSAMLILYLMWKMHKPFNETHEYVKKLRQASSPNAGFISQLMQWWKWHTSPLSKPALYQVVPHCPVSPDTIVFISLASVSAQSLDKRGCFVLVALDAIYVWSGKACPRQLQEWGVRYAKRVQKYENRPSPVVEQAEGTESPEFKALFGGSLSKVKRRSEYDSSYQLLKIPSRTSLERAEDEGDRVPHDSSRRKSTHTANSSIVSNGKKKKKSKRKLGDRVASTSKIGRLKGPDS